MELACFSHSILVVAILIPRAAVRAVEIGRWQLSKHGQAVGFNVRQAGSDLLVVAGQTVTV
jgi:hypothetical protein